MKQKFTREEVHASHPLSDLRDIGPWGPAVFDICHKLGPTAAMVFAVVRFNQRKSGGVSNEASETIASRLNLHPDTVQDALRKLRRAGYIVDLTPTLRRAPHVYVDSGLAGTYRVRVTEKVLKEDIHREETTRTYELIPTEGGEEVGAGNSRPNLEVGAGKSRS